jgi:hypothetical protein
MAIKIRKRAKTSGVTGDPEELNVDDKLAVLKQNTAHARKLLPKYIDLQEELDSYTVDLPEEVDIPDISKINKLYAIAQSFISRVTTMEAVAISNHTRWLRLCNLMKGYLADKESEALIDDEIKDLGNARLQQAAVRTRLLKVHSSFERLQDYETEAESFKRLVEIKKKDLTLVLTNLNRQVKALGLERNPHF